MAEEPKSPPSRPPNSVNVRRNPPRRARPTPSSLAPAKISLSSTPSKNIPFFPIEDILSIQVPQKIIENENLKVFLRIRPQSIAQAPCKKGGASKNVWPQCKQIAKPKPKKKSEVCLRENDAHSVTLCPPQSLQDQKRNKSEVYEGFSHVFPADSSQDDVFEKMVKPIVEDFVKGKSGMLAALGPSGSGKTHTIFGTARQPGMIPLALRRIFSGTEGSEAQSSRTYYLSMFEICSERGKSERMIDLCNDGVDICLQQSTIRGLHESTVCDVQQAEALIAQGMLKRATAMTNSNSQSSRSQCIINIRCETCGDVIASSNSALLTIVDLAGAEREKKTGNQGARLLESNFINNTSMVFGLCLRSLLDHQKNRKKPLQKHFKNSLLTRYLRDYLEGKKRMALILTVKSGEEDYLDASFLLRQASPYMKIKFTNCEEPSDLVGNKRQFQPFLKADQQKKMKMSTIESSAVNEKIYDVVGSTPHEEERKNAITMKKVNMVEATTFLADSPETLKSNFGESPFVKDNISASKRLRLSQIMQGFAKATWQVLKQYKEKLKVAEKEIYCLRQSLTQEKARSDNLEKELAQLKSTFMCENIVSTDKIVTKEVGSRGDGLDGSAESDCKSVDSHELRSSSVVSTSSVDRGIFEEQSCQVEGASSIIRSESEVTVNNQSTDSNVISSCVVSTSCIREEIIEGQHCQKHVEYFLGSKDLEFSEGKDDSNNKGTMLFKDSSSSIPAVLISDGITSSVEGHQSKNDTEKVAGASSVNLSESEFTVNNQSTDSSVISPCVVITSCVGEEIFEGPCSQRVNFPGGSEDLKILKEKEGYNQNGESKFTVNNQSTDSSVISPCVVITSCVGEEIFEGPCSQRVNFPGGFEDLEILKEKEDSNQNGESKFTVNNQSTDSSVISPCVVITSCVGEEIFEGPCSQRVKFPGGAEDLEILKEKEDSNQNVTGIMFLEDSAKSIQSVVLTSDDSSSLVQGQQSQNGTEKKMLDQAAMSNEVQEVAVEVISCPKPPNADKPKRRLQPASSMLLKNISGLDIEERNEKPKGARGAKRNMGLDLTRKTQGSLSLIHLLKDNL